MSALPPSVGRPGPTAWHRFDPLTRLTVALAVVVVATVSGGVACTVVVVALGVIVPAGVARVVRPVIRDALVLGLPLAVSVLLVNAFLYPEGGTVVAEIGPLRVSGDGLALGVQVTVRVVAIAAALVLFSRTTRPSELVATLERRGVPARLTFVVHQALVLVPRTLERAAIVAAAQRARGFDSESSWWRRVRGVFAVAAPTVLGAIDDAEVRTLTLEARGFSRPGPRTLLWAPRDSTAQRVARWLVVGAVAVYVVARISGLGLPC
jgi:energy-coupling factor transport system permease protein